MKLLNTYKWVPKKISPSKVKIGDIISIGKSKTLWKVTRKAIPYGTRKGAVEYLGCRLVKEYENHE